MNDALRERVEEGRSCAGTGVEAAGEVERGSGRLERARDRCGTVWDFGMYYGRDFAISVA